MCGFTPCHNRAIDFLVVKFCTFGPHFVCSVFFLSLSRNIPFCHSSSLLLLILLLYLPLLHLLSFFYSSNITAAKLYVIKRFNFKFIRLWWADYFVYTFFPFFLFIYFNSNDIIALYYSLNLYTLSLSTAIFNEKDDLKMIMVLF